VIEYLLPIFAYLCGSISTAVVVAAMMGIADPRDVGSRNPGATNIMRYGGKLAAGLTLSGDVLKGVVPVLLARALSDNDIVMAGSVYMAFLGHLFPVFFRFHGGKGVATALGAWLAMAPIVGAALIVTWVLVAATSRYSSLSALVAAALGPIYVLLWKPGIPFLIAIIAMTALLFWRHSSNIRNLLAGTEGKICVTKS
jgi:glycerol-3-phosphate acyltransferase PlsY